MKKEKKEKAIFKFDSDSDDNENENEEENYSNQKKNSQSPSNDGKNEESDEAKKLRTLVNKLLNFGKSKKKYDIIYETDYAFFLKNKDISSNFEKRAKNEETLYGWFIPHKNDDELMEKMIMRLRDKGLEKIDHEIMVLPPEDYNIDDLYSVIICRFILGKNVGVNQEKELSEKQKEEYLKNNYDTVYRVNRNAHTLKPPKRYNILKKENIELLYFVNLKKSLYE